MRSACFRVVFAVFTIFGVAASATAGPSVRVADYPAALAAAKESGNDIVVFQRGSDWNRLGEALYREVWLNPEFPKELGEGFVLVAVDRPEQPGMPALGGSGDGADVVRFLKAAAGDGGVGANEISAVSTAGGAVFKRREDGTWRVEDPKNEHNPHHDTLDLTIESRRGGQILRLDFLPDPALPNGCAGRASNGNFAVSEITVTKDGKPFQPTHAWGSYAEAAMPAAQAIDGIADQAGNGWNPAANARQPRTLLLALPEALRMNGRLKLRIVCQSAWGQHVPGCLRGRVLEDPTLAAGLAKVTEAQALAARNAAFDWWDGSHCPRVALLDAEGRAVAAEDKPRGGLTPATLAVRVRELRDRRIARDECLVRAEKLQGTERAEALRLALVALDIRNWGGNGDCYKIIHQKIKEADPADAGGASRWLGFSADPKGGVPWAKPAWNEALDTQGGKRTLGDADYQEALARVDKELADPRNGILDPENIQRMMVAKFHIYRSWKGHEEERFRIQREIAAFNPDTFWGIGARGYLGMYGKSETPFLTYGWKPEQLTAGANVWKMTDCSDYFDHAGAYKVTLAHAGGADKARVKRLALMDGETVIAEARPDADLGPGPLAKLEVTLDCKAWQAGKEYVFVTELEATEGHTDLSGRFQIEPWFGEPAAVAGKPQDYERLQRRLREKLAPALTTKLAAAVEKPAVRADLAQYELLRRCGADAVTRVAAGYGGEAFLKAFTGDAAWLDSFLLNDECPWPQALDNLRFLHANGREIDVPLYRRVATAMAMSAGAMNRYRLLERYHDIVRVHREGLMHVSFDALDVREMRWAVLLTGTAADFQWMVDMIQNRTAEYVGACWVIPYIDPNVYGYSVQGWGYADPWTHHYGTGTGDRPFRVQRQVGGVCGTLSGFGAAASKAHGVMATTVGQPGHCAYVVRIGLEWPTGNDVSGPETNGASVFEGTGFPSMHRLYEPMHADRAAYQKAGRLAWAAHVLLDRLSAPGWRAEWFGAYGQALAAQPINYPLWLECIKALESAPDVPSDTWRKLMPGIAAAFKPYHEAGWALLNRCMAVALPPLTAPERVALLLKCHESLKQANAPLFMGYNLGATLNAQADAIGDPALALDFMRKLLSIHFSENPAQNRVFGMVMNWGRERFGANPATAAAYAKAVGSFFAALGDAADANEMRNAITAGIRKSSEAGDAAAYQLWTSMAARLLPPAAPGDVHLNPEQAKAAPEIRPFPGELLGKTGMLQTSSASQFDRPLSYGAVLDGSAPGWFDTNAEEKPWAQVTLAGDAALSGLVLVNRYEYTPEQDEFRWVAPLKVLVSNDGTTWTEVASVERPEAVMRVDLAGKAERVRYLRIERQAREGKTKPPGRLHLRNFLVYGKRLY